ncbi:MAG TPA: rod shape-determining protein MreC [Candidatus Paceibacterota bacterium]|nr:rod shape-determining protein MreC [Candidatus Paceibacterota bacterium]HMP18862.1 rod shape-determining protein MreC [Candidatus Paceibacterota bacterium]HMP85174.1 rod shape-determining protein MreC [Candidatus Paceibacterota bacterium]
MTYLQKNKKNNYKKIIVPIIILIIIFAGSFLSRLVHYVNLPINNSFNYLTQKINPIFIYFKSKKDLVNQNNILFEENKKLKVESIAVEFFKSENQELKRILNYKESDSKHFLAKILNSIKKSPQDTFVIDVGQDVVSEKDTVYYLDIPIGFVESVYQNSSIARLYSSSGQKIQVEIRSEQDVIKTEAIGMSSGNFKISIPKDIPVSPDSTIIFNGSVMGVVNNTEIDSSNTFQNIYFNFPFNISTINWVIVKK